MRRLLLELRLNRGELGAPFGRTLALRRCEIRVRQLAEASPHRLRHGLAYRLLESGATPAYVQAILGHSRVSTALQHGKPTEQDTRAALARANAFRGRG